MKWLKSDSNNMADALRHMFKYEPQRTIRSIRHEQLCYDPKVLMNLVNPQILEVISQDLGYKTPEEWDESFAVLGGGQQRRKSSAILKIMNWDQFVDKIEEIKLKLES